MCFSFALHGGTDNGTVIGVIAPMVAAIADPASALHVSCVKLRASGAGLLKLAQAEGAARADIDGDDLFALIAALAWFYDQPSFAPRAEHLLNVIASAIMTPQAAADPYRKGRRATRR